MKGVRDHVEELIVARLSVTRPDDLPDSIVEHDFRALAGVFEVVMDKTLRKTHIPSFTDEDLVSFMLLHAHLLLRRQAYDFNRNPYSFFHTAFTNLMRDIIRAQNRKKCQDMYWDIFDMHDLFDNRHFGLDPERTEAFVKEAVA